MARRAEKTVNQEKGEVINYEQTLVFQAHKDYLIFLCLFCGGEEILKIFDRCFAVNTRKVCGGKERREVEEGSILFNSRKSNINQSSLLMPVFIMF